MGTSLPCFVATVQGLFLLILEDGDDGGVFGVQSDETSRRRRGRVLLRHLNGRRSWLIGDGVGTRVLDYDRAILERRIYVSSSRWRVIRLGSVLVLLLLLLLLILELGLLILRLRLRLGLGLSCLGLRLRPIRLPLGDNDSQCEKELNCLKQRENASDKFKSEE